MRGIFAGSFDLCHAGHMMAFKEAKENCDYLIVALHSDPSTDRPEKNKPIMGVNERRIILEGIRYIDEIVGYDTEADLVSLVNTLDLDVYFIGEDWIEKEFSAKQACFNNDVVIHYLSRKHAYSSSELRKRIREMV